MRDLQGHRAQQQPPRALIQMVLDLTEDIRQLELEHI